VASHSFRLQRKITKVTQHVNSFLRLEVVVVVAGHAVQKAWVLDAERAVGLQQQSCNVVKRERVWLKQSEEVRVHNPVELVVC